MSRQSSFAHAFTQLTHAAAALLMLGLSLAAKPVLADAAPSTGTAKPAVPASAWRLLRHQDCKPLDAQDQRRLPASWHPYLAATRRCELTPPGGSAQITLISIFAIDYYEGKPDTASWEAFPRPLLVDREFSCVGGLPELFPYDQPSTLQLRHGRWSGGFPQEIRLHVKNPAVSGNYDLPTLRWNQAQRRYQPVGTPAKEDPCPTP